MTVNSEKWREIGKAEGRSLQNMEGEKGLE